MFYRRQYGLCRRQYQVGGKRFLTKASIKSHIRILISKYADGEVLNTEDSDFVRDLITHHPGIKDGVIDVGSNLTTGSKHFRADGKPFSWNCCVDLMGLSEAKKMARVIKDASRNTIRPQIQEYLDLVAIDVFVEPRYLCEISGDIYERVNVHVDHHFDLIQFKDILQQYLEVNREVEVEDGLLKEPHFTKFSDFHKQKAILRIIKKEINIRGKLR